MVKNVVAWWMENNLQLKIDKTEELVVDFCCVKELVRTVTMQGEEVEMV